MLQFHGEGEARPYASSYVALTVPSHKHAIVAVPILTYSRLIGLGEAGEGEARWGRRSAVLRRLVLILILRSSCFRCINVVTLYTRKLEQSKWLERIFFPFAAQRRTDRVLQET